MSSFARAEERGYGSSDDAEDMAMGAEQDLLSSESNLGESTDEDSEDDIPRIITEEHYNAVRTTVIEIVTALGGIEDVANEHGDTEKVYVIGDDCLRCLRDLRTLLHQDQDNPSRVIPMIFAQVNVVHRGLLPLLMKVVDMGDKGTKIALACTDLLTTLTWPIDIVAEQQAALNLDNGSSPLQSYRHMQFVFISYKAALLRSRSNESRGSQRSLLASITLHILLPALSKSRHNRTPRDTGTIGMCLHLFRNLLAIRDPVATSLSGYSALGYSNLQNELLVELKNAHVLDTMLMLASNAESSDFEAWNIITAECVYHIYAGARPEQLLERAKETGSLEAVASHRITSALLLSSLAAESRQKSLDVLASGVSRHSRYSTTISFKDDAGAVRVARSQHSLRMTPEELIEMNKEKQKRRRGGRSAKKIDEVGAARMRAPWTPAAAKVASEWAEQFLEVGFESLARSVLKDIRSESFKAGDIDQTRTRFMRLSHVFLEYFLLLKSAKDAERASRGETTADEDCDIASFAVVDYWLEPWALKMAWLRASTALNDKAWLEFVTAVQLWTTLLRLVETLARSPTQHDRDRAEGIQALHFYNELTLDAAKSVTRAFTSQSFRCLETIVDFAHIMPRMLERYSKDKGNLFVRLKRQAKKDAASDGQNLNVQDQEVQQMVESTIKERRFEFQKFQTHLCTNQLMDACLAYLQRWQEVDEGAEQRMAGVVHVLHRLAIKASNLRLFYPHNRRTALKKIQKDQAFWSFLQSKSAQVSDDMGKLLKHVLSRFEKLDAEEKALWSEGMKAPKPAKAFKMPPEIEIADSRGALSDQHIAVGLLLGANMIDFVTWLVSELREVCRARECILKEELETERRKDEDARDEGEAEWRAFERYSAYTLSYHDSDRIREEASTRPEAKLLCRLLGLRSNEEDDHHWEWVAQKDLHPHELSNSLTWIETEIVRISDSGPPEVPYTTQVKPKSRRRQLVINEFGDEEEVHIPIARGARKNARAGLFFDNDMIDDSDEEIETAERILALQRRRQGDGADAQVQSTHASQPVPPVARASSLESTSNVNLFDDVSERSSQASQSTSSTPEIRSVQYSPPFTPRTRAQLLSGGFLRARNYSTSEDRDRFRDSELDSFSELDQFDYSDSDSESLNSHGLYGSERYLSDSFLHSEFGDDDDDENEDEEGTNHASPTKESSLPGPVKMDNAPPEAPPDAPIAVQKRTLKRAHRAASRGSADGTDDDADADDESAGGAKGDVVPTVQVRKRRAMVVLDDEDEE